MRIIKTIWRWAFRAFAFVGFLTAGLTLAVWLGYTFRNVDNLDRPFVDDPQALGWWTSVDFVNSPQDFNPNVPQWSHELFFKSMELRPGGSTDKEWMTWTKGMILNHGGDHTASTYEIREIQGVTYLFFQWKSGEYIYFHKKPPYYVLRYSGPPGQKIVDNIDLPFVNDPDVLGQWASVDFVERKDELSPGSRHWDEELYLKGMTFYSNGGFRYSIAVPDTQSKPQPWVKWTKGVVMHSGDHTASKYEIRQIGGGKYMFFEWKSGDYTIRHCQPLFYVLQWTGEAPATNPAATTMPAP
jgi:bla regulator protein BlaR1